MNKYEITAGLNYLKESTLNEFNPYNEKGDRWDDEPKKYNPKLVSKETGEEVKLPYKTVDFRGDPMTVIGFTPPHKPSSTGRIEVEGGMTEYFPSVAGLKIIGHEFDDMNESTEDDDLRDEESGKNHDPKTGKRTKPHPFDPGEEELHEGKMSEIHAAANELSKEEFAKEYPDWVDEYENAQVGPDEDDTVHEAGKPSRPKKGKLVDKKTGQEVRLPYETVDFRGDKIVITGYQAPHKRGSSGRIYTDDGDQWSYFPGHAGLKILDYGPLEEADGSGSYGGQSPLSYDTQRSSKMEDDNELNEIKKLSGLKEDILSDRKIWLGTSLEKDAKEKLKTVSKEDIAMAKAIDPEISGSPFPDMSILDIINKRVMLITKKWNDSLLSKNYPMGTTKEDIEQAVYNQIGNYLESGILDEIEDGYSDINAYRGPAYVEWKQSLGPNADELIKQAVSMSTNRHTNWHVGSNLDTDALYTKDEYELIDPNLGSGKAEKFGMWADDELNEITKLSGLGEAKRKPRPDDFDDEDDEDDTPEDPDKDKVPHILMQIKKAIDVDGDHDIKFEDGGKHKFSITDLNMFFKKYMSMKPAVREQMQEVAIMGKEEFDTILSIINPKKK